LNILIDIGHPAHVHYYRNLAKELSLKGHNIVWSVKYLPIAMQLLDYYGFSYHVLPKKSDSITGKFFKQLQYSYKILRICRKYDIDIAIGTSATIAHISKLSRVKSIIFDDDDDKVQPIATIFINPFADALLSPDVLKGKRKRKDAVYYSGYHELAYLHPRRFTPDPNVLKELGLSENEPFFILRFNVFKAHHDIGAQGLSLDQKLQIVEILKPHGKVFVTTERNTEPELLEYKLKVSPEKAHSLMAYATLFLGDSQTMSSEAAILGVPSLRCNSFAGRISYLEEEEKKYGLTYAFLPEDFNKMLIKVKELLNMPDLKKEWQERRHVMLSDKIDVTAFWVWFVENYPESKKIMKGTPEYQYRFR